MSPLGGTGQLPSFRIHGFFSHQDSKLDFSSRGSQECRTIWWTRLVVLRMNKNFMKSTNLNYPWILKQRFPTFGTVISVADDEQDDVDWDGLRIDVYMYQWIHDRGILYIYDIHVHVYIHMYIHKYISMIYTITCSINNHTQVTWSPIKYIRLYTSMLTITIKNTFL